MSLTFIQLGCSKCGSVFEILGTPTPEDLDRPLCSGCEKGGAREDMADAEGIETSTSAPTHTHPGPRRV